MGRGFNWEVLGLGLVVGVRLRWGSEALEEECECEGAGEEGGGICCVHGGCIGVCIGACMACVNMCCRAEGGGRGRGRLVAREELLDRGGEAAAPRVGAARAVVVVAHLQEGG